MNKWYQSEECLCILQRYSEGMSISECARAAGITRGQMQYAIKTHGVKSCISFEAGGRECNRKRSVGLLAMPNSQNEIVKEKAKDHQTARLKQLGFEYINGSKSEETFTIRCLSCGCVFARRYNSTYRKKINCPGCINQKKHEVKLARQRELESKEAERKAQQEKKRQKESIRLHALHICKVCGKEYSIHSYMESTGTKYRRDSGFCSKECRDSHKEQRDKERARIRGPHSEHHYDRAKRLGLPAEKGVTLKKLYIRDGGVCQICGMACSYSGSPLSDLYPSIDHIIPMGKDQFKEGGHTWSNVQLAHRICNSVKSAKRGEEWHNGTEKTA